MPSVQLNKTGIGVSTLSDVMAEGDPGKVHDARLRNEYHRQPSRKDGRGRDKKPDMVEKADKAGVSREEAVDPVGGPLL